MFLDIFLLVYKLIFSLIFCKKKHRTQNRSNFVSNFLGAFFIILCIMCILGNILVIISVFTYKPLQNVQNMFIISLAIADLLVCILCVPFHIITEIANGVWLFGPIICQFFITTDILLCTASILNLCCIALDRYWAIKDSIVYAQKRTFKRVLAMILISWVISVFVSVPGILWNTKDFSFKNEYNNKSIKNHNNTENTPELICYISKDKSYRFYSSFGTFYIPLIIMTFVYLRIYLETKKRLGERAKAAKKLANSIAKSSSESKTKTIKNGKIKKEKFLRFCPYLNKKHESTSNNTQNTKENGFTCISIEQTVVTNTANSNEVSLKPSTSAEKPIELEFKDKKIQFDVSIKKTDENTEESDEINTEKPNFKACMTKLKSHAMQNNKNDLESKTKKIASSLKIIDSYEPHQPLLDIKTNQNNVQTPHASVGINTTKPWKFNSANTNNILKQREKISLTRERRSARTLGIIMVSY